MIKVIVTDDMTLFRTGVKMSLAAREDIEVIGEAENGQVLLDLLDRITPDVITLNIQMPVMDGFTTLPVLRKRYPGIKILMISMHSDSMAIRKAIELGAHGYLTKEAGSEIIYQAIKQLFNGWFYINRTLAEALIKTENKLNPLLPPELSERDKRFLALLCAGHTEEQIGRILEMRLPLVQAYIDKMIRVHQVKTKEELVLLNI